MEGKSPWFTMWTKPKETIQKVIDFNPNYQLGFLSLIYGFVSLMGSFQSMSLGYRFNFFLIILIGLVCAPIWGYIVFSVSSFLVFITGKILKGQGSFKQVRASFAWANVPLIANIFLWIVLFLFFQDKVFKDFPGGHVLQTYEIVVLFSILFLQLVLSIWVLVLYVNALAQVQKFSIIKSILNIIFALVVAFIIGLIIVNIISMFINMKQSGAA